MPCMDSGPVSDYSGEWNKCEKDLCRARWTLLQLMKICKLKEVSLPNSLLAHVQRERNEQLRHRRDDRSSVIQGIKSDIHGLNRDIEDIKKLGGEPSRAILKKKSKLEEDIQLLKNVSDEELLEGSWDNPVTLVEKLAKGGNHATTR